MFKKTLIILPLPLLFLVAVTASLCRGAVGSSPTTARRHSAVATASETGTLQKMIVGNGSVTIDLDLNGLNGSGSLVARPVALQFVVGANSFFPILVFNDLLRGPEPGSMTLIPAGVETADYGLPGTLAAALKELVVEKLATDQG